MQPISKVFLIVLLVVVAASIDSNAKTVAKSTLEDGEPANSDPKASAESKSEPKEAHTELNHVKSEKIDSKKQTKVAKKTEESKHDKTVVTNTGVKKAETEESENKITEKSKKAELDHHENKGVKDDENKNNLVVKKENVEAEPRKAEKKQKHKHTQTRKTEVKIAEEEKSQSKKNENKKTGAKENENENSDSKKQEPRRD